MKRYNIKVEEIISTEFQLDAKNKLEARKLVEEIIYETCILKLNCVNHKKDIKLIINRVKRKK